MAKFLPVPFHPQKSDGYCLAACTQMVLAYQGVNRSQESLAKLLRVKPALGTAARNIRLLISPTISVTFAEGTLDDLQKWLKQSLPIIVFVQGGELPYWSDEFFQHAIVVIGLQETAVWLLDPDKDSAPVFVSQDEFLLAWGEMDYLYAAIVVSA